MCLLHPHYPICHVSIGAIPLAESQCLPTLYIFTLYPPYLILSVSKCYLPFFGRGWQEEEILRFPGVQNSFKFLSDWIKLKYASYSTKCILITWAVIPVPICLIVCLQHSLYWQCEWFTETLRTGNMSQPFNQSLLRNGHLSRVTRPLRARRLLSISQSYWQWFSHSICYDGFADRVESSLSRNFLAPSVQFNRSPSDRFTSNWFEVSKFALEVYFVIYLITSLLLVLFYFAWWMVGVPIVG